MEILESFQQEYTPLQTPFKQTPESLMDMPKKPRVLAPIVPKNRKMPRPGRKPVVEEVYFFTTYVAQQYTQIATHPAS